MNFKIFSVKKIMEVSNRLMPPVSAILNLLAMSLPLSLLLSSCSGGPATSPSSCTAPTTTAAISAKLPKPQLRVFGGSDLSSSTYSFTGGLFYSFSNYEGLCTANLICPNVILTAAHCVYQAGPASNPANANAPTSSYYFSQSATIPFTGSAADGSNLPSDASAATQVVVHPGWQGAGANLSVADDMAILQLTNSYPGQLAPLSYTSLAAPQSQTATPATAIGYGELQENDGNESGLFGVGTKREGSVYYQGPYQNDQGTLLTLRGSTGQDTCEGDSGGPLLINNQIYGTLSGGDSSGCGLPIGTPTQSGGTVEGVSYYSSVSNNASWIQSVMLELCGTTTPSPKTGSVVGSTCSSGN